MKKFMRKRTNEGFREKRKKVKENKKKLMILQCILPFYKEIMTTRFVTCHHLIAKKQRKKPIESKLEREKETIFFCCRFFHIFGLFLVLRKYPVKEKVLVYGR
jgi:hypothetical protein